MKNKHWAIVLSCILVLCLGASLLFFRTGVPAAHAEIRSDGKLVKTVALSQNQQFTVTSDYGNNVITVRDGKIAVTDADCPDGYCIARGFCDSGPQIVCLPHRLTITFTNAGQIDGMVG